MSAPLAEAIAYAQAVISQAGPDGLARIDAAASVYERVLAGRRNRREAFLAAMASLGNEPVGRRSAGSRPHVPESARTVVRAIAMMGEVSVAALIGPSQARSVMRWRKLAYYVLRRHKYSFPIIGAALGGRDHSAVLLGIRSFERSLAADDEMRDLAAKLTSVAPAPAPAREAA